LAYLSAVGLFRDDFFFLTGAGCCGGGCCAGEYWPAGGAVACAC
jgi:hypothetical protein